MSQSPVSEGEFPTGPELMLWRPGLDLRRLRRRTVLWPALRTFAAAALGEIGIAALVTDEVPREFWLMIPLSIVLTGASAVAAAVDYRCVEYDHQHRPCWLERSPGRFFYRMGDFPTLPPATLDHLRRIITAVHRIHLSPAATWLNPQQLHDIHQMAWGTSHILYRTQALRDVLVDPRCTQFVEAAHARSQLATVDDVVERVLTSLLQAELLVTSWEQKLADMDLLGRLRKELNQATWETIVLTRQQADAVPEGAFAYVTAARDVTSTGPFDWERSASHITTPQDDRRHDERGSVAAELTLLTPLLILLLLLVVLCGRTVDTKLRINDVAHQAARAASQARTPSQATAAAQSTADDALASAGITCRHLDVATDTQGLRPGSAITVTVSCSVGLADLTMLGVPGSRTFQSSFSSPVDLWRGTTALAEEGGTR